jgi:hypothetical protein
MQSGIRWRKVLALFFAYRKQKKHDFDSSFIRNFAPRRFDKYVFVPSVGASGGILLVWNNTVFDGTVLDKQRYGITVRFTSTHTSQS